jgi:OOP family OmpA-OmpF porin
MMKRTTVLFALGTAVAMPVFGADSDVGRTYVTPSIGVLRADSERATDRDNVIGGLAIGRHLSPAWSLELTLNGTALDGANPALPDYSVYGGSLDLLRVFNRSGAFSPYIGVGAGVLEWDVRPGAARPDAMAQASIGAFWTLWEGSGSSFALRPDFKARWDDAHSAGHLVDYIGTLGFQFSFGGAPRVASTPPAPPPAPEPAVAAPAPEPAAPPPPADTDGDGVTDNRDQCPGTPRGVAVDENGCPQRGSITREGVTFEYNSAVLTADSARILDGVADGLKKYPRLRVELQGHTDSRGPDAYNLTLSEKRANAVREYLLKAGVASQQISAKGYGEAQPIADNNTEAGRAKNRRVVMYVLENPGDVDVKGAGEVK